MLLNGFNTVSGHNYLLFSVSSIPHISFSAGMYVRKSVPLLSASLAIASVTAR